MAEKWINRPDQVPNKVSKVGELHDFNFLYCLWFLLFLDQSTCCSSAISVHLHTNLCVKILKVNSKSILITILSICVLLYLLLRWVKIKYITNYKWYALSAMIRILIMYTPKDICSLLISCPQKFFFFCNEIFKPFENFGYILWILYFQGITQY